MVVEAVESASVVINPLRGVVGAGTVAALGVAAHTALNLRDLRSPHAPATEISEKVSILIPARDEAGVIEAAVRSALAQRGLADFEVIVLDDGSTDATAAIVSSITDARLTLEQSADELPPQGWLGKTWACHRLSLMATGSVLVFLDADVVLEPDAVAACIAELRAHSFALIAPYPRQETRGVVTSLMQPLLTWSWASMIPLRIAEQSARPSLSAANGQLLVFDAAAYRTAGGHEAVANDVIEDVALMRAVKISAGTAATVNGSHLASCRMYDSSEQLIDGYTKSLWAAFGGPAGSVAVNALLAGMYVLPAVAMVSSTNRSTRALGALGYAAGVASRAMVASRTGASVPSAFAHPVAVAAFVGLNALSWRRHLAGTNAWKGRALP